MQFNLNPLTDLSQEIRAWRDSNNKISKERQEALKMSVGALSKAILETKAYLRNGLNNRIQEKEDQIRELWNQAHIQLRSTDKELAARCFRKAEYWTDPINWNDQMIDQYNISLDSMSESLKRL